MNVIFGFVVLIIGVINLISPQTGWYLSRGWQFKDAEPSDEALVWGRIAGVISIAAAFYIMFTV